MDSEHEDESNLATPPYFKSWRSIYLIVLGVLVLIIFLLQLFSTSFA